MKQRIALRKCIENITHTCPVANVPYIGDCPIYTCPANLAGLTSGKRSGCYYLHGKGTNHLAACEITGLQSSEVQTRYNAGLKNLERLVTTYHLLGACRENLSSSKTCRSCGVGIVNGSACLNTSKCNERLRLITRAMRRYPYNLPQLSVTPAMMWWLLQHGTTLPYPLPPKLVQNGLNLLKNLPQTSEAAT